MEKKVVPDIIGHRGAAGLVFENTLASIQKAIELGVQAIEIDVWKTTDGEILVFHDAYLERLTSETGLIAEADPEFLKKVRLKNGDPIPTLKEVISLVKPHKIPLLVEVKAENAFEETLKLLETELDHEAFIIGSFYHQKIMELKQRNETLQTAIMLECVPANFDAYLQKVNPDFVVASIETHNAYFIETIKSQHRKLFFYTVNLEAEIAMALQAKPHGIITNFPDRLLKAVKDN